MTSIIYLKSVRETVPLLPQRATSLSAGWDLCADITEPLELAPGERRLVPTGWSVAIPQGMEAQIRPRSGLALKHGVTVLNTPGTIDADYRGEIQVILVNLGQSPFLIEPKMRIAQMVFAHVAPVVWEQAGQLPDTERGQGGFGSTGT